MLVELSSEPLNRGECIVDLDRLVKPAKVLQQLVPALALVFAASIMRSLGILTFLDQINQLDFFRKLGVLIRSWDAALPRLLDFGAEFEPVA